MYFIMKPFYIKKNHQKFYLVLFLFIINIERIPYSKTSITVFKNFGSWDIPKKLKFPTHEAFFNIIPQLAN